MNNQNVYPIPIIGNETYKQVKGGINVAEYELKDVVMDKSGESIQFAHGTLMKTELDGKEHVDVVLRNVPREEVFTRHMNDNETVKVNLTSFAGEEFNKELEVTSVNSTNPNDNLVQLESIENNL
ncbi:hypothetical protein [Bacillus marinisedimentorum]|uniref:hypothetical protein n=1 Tax=Bacillus marinisedimentorum TaxID=1821260 RepID=UPI00147197EF|nr:hypothetical protein [Bacillus marinisedimentorum]